MTISEYRLQVLNKIKKRKILTTKEIIFNILFNNMLNETDVNIRDLNNVCFRYAARIHELRKILEDAEIKSFKQNNKWFFKMEMVKT